MWKVIVIRTDGSLVGRLEPPARKVPAALARAVQVVVEGLLGLLPLHPLDEVRVLFERLRPRPGRVRGVVEQGQGLSRVVEVHGALRQPEYDFFLDQVDVLSGRERRFQDRDKSEAMRLFARRYLGVFSTVSL